MTKNIGEEAKVGRTIKKRVVRDEEIEELGLVYKTHHMEERRCHLTFGLDDERDILRERNGRQQGTYDIIGHFRIN